MQPHIRDDDFIPFIHGKMMGTMNLAAGVTEHDEIEVYKQTDHINYFAPSGKAFICISIHDELLFVHFAWNDGSNKARKEFAELSKFIYKKYTLGMNKPMYYTGINNYWQNNSFEVRENLWIFEPKKL